MERVKLQDEAMKQQMSGNKDVKVAKLTEDDIVSYLTKFERLTTALKSREKDGHSRLPRVSVGNSEGMCSPLCNGCWRQ